MVFSVVCSGFIYIKIKDGNREFVQVFDFLLQDYSGESIMEPEHQFAYWCDQHRRCAVKVRTSVQRKRTALVDGSTTIVKLARGD